MRAHARRACSWSGFGRLGRVPDVARSIRRSSAATTRPGRAAPSLRRRARGRRTGRGGARVSRRRLIIFATLAFAVFGFFVVRAPAPVIALAAEPVISIGSYEITNTILSAWVVILLLAIAAFVVWRRTRDVETALVPSGFQNLVEAIYEAFLGISQQVGGERNGKKFFPFVFTI
ncbi:MAG: hypothetical protein F4Y95_08205, partial [Chloroflexi bacterium]|nr:hypothetical protein [Chloroflexota bacterium]